MRIGLLVIVVALIAVCEARGMSAELVEARRLHDLGVAGDEAKVRECIAFLERLVEDDPKNQRARVYLGSAYTLLARDLPVGPGKLDALKKGGQLMDSAVEAAPRDAVVRLVRAVNSYRLPAMFGRKKVALADFRELVGQVEGGAVTLEPAELQAVYFFAASGARSEKNRSREKELLGAALRAAPEGELVPEIRKRLGR